MFDYSFIIIINFDNGTSRLPIEMLLVCKLWWRKSRNCSMWTSRWLLFEIFNVFSRLRNSQRLCTLLFIRLLQPHFRLVMLLRKWLQRGHWCHQPANKQPPGPSIFLRHATFCSLFQINYNIFFLLLFFANLRVQPSIKATFKPKFCVNYKDLLTLHVHDFFSLIAQPPALH